MIYMFCLIKDNSDVTYLKFWEIIATHSINHNLFQIELKSLYFDFLVKYANNY